MTAAGMRFSIAAYDLPMDDLCELAVAAEAVGFDLLWLGEHLAVPAGVTSSHPTTGHGTGAQPLRQPVLGDSTVLYDPWVALTAVARETTRLHVATGILILPLWHPLQVARASATVQAAAGGRFQLGVGAGWVREEFAALGMDFEDRGARMDEQLEVLRAVWAGGAVAGEGRHYPFDSLHICAEPVTVPLIVGGHSPPALRRAARIGDGWISSGTAGLDEAARCRDEMMRQRRGAGRDHLPFTTWVRLPSAQRHHVEACVERGFENLVVWADQVWPRGADRGAAQKVSALAAHAEELGVRANPADLELTR